jgi:hypothetical protein
LWKAPILRIDVEAAAELICTCRLLYYGFAFRKAIRSSTSKLQSPQKRIFVSGIFLLGLARNSASSCSLHTSPSWPAVFSAEE